MALAFQWPDWLFIPSGRKVALFGSCCGFALTPAKPGSMPDPAGFIRKEWVAVNLR